MVSSCDTSRLPYSFRISITRGGIGRYHLNTTQIFPVSRATAFTFFEDPGNLCDITPPWLDFRLHGAVKPVKVCVGSEFDSHIRWFGVLFQWRSRIIHYKPPSAFTDIQLIGPYNYWEHRHEFKDVPEGTQMTDEVVYVLPFGILGDIIHALVVTHQLQDIFCYRAAKINDWALRQAE